MIGLRDSTVVLIILNRCQDGFCVAGITTHELVSGLGAHRERVSPPSEVVLLVRD